VQVEAVKCAKGDLEDSREAWASYRKLLCAYATMRPLMDAFADDRIAADGSFTPPSISPENSGNSRGRAAPVFVNKPRPGGITRGEAPAERPPGLMVSVTGIVSPQRPEAHGDAGGSEKLNAQTSQEASAAQEERASRLGGPDGQRRKGAAGMQRLLPGLDANDLFSGPAIHTDAEQQSVAKGAEKVGLSAAQPRGGSAGKRGKLGFVVDATAVQERMQSEL
jgi:hypothetical protein